MDAGRSRPRSSLMPVGFVNVVEARSYSRDACRPSSRGVAQGQLDRGSRHYERAALQITLGRRSDGARIRAGAAHLRQHHRGSPSVRMGERGGHSRRCLLATEYGGELLGELPGIEVYAGQARRADGAASFPARVIVGAAHPFATLASGNIRAASLAVILRYLRLARPARRCPKASCQVRRSPARRFLSGQVRSSHDEQELAPTRASPISWAFFDACAPLPGAITKCIDAGFSPSHVIGMQGPSPASSTGDASAGGRPVAYDQDSGTVGGTAEKLAAALWERTVSWSPVPPGKAGPLPSGSGRCALTGVRALGARGIAPPYERIISTGSTIQTRCHPTYQGRRRIWRKQPFNKLR